LAHDHGSQAKAPSRTDIVAARRRAASFIVASWAARPNPASCPTIDP
jgi:hypothetical protein